ncbi:hypothetical protein RJT34_19361 [Clitoria ternatea]|uniref:Cyclotide n=1 Tax=Clitoria ternatea TaxID=43366 RepID=A0AAN9P3L8_CLITE
MQVNQMFSIYITLVLSYIHILCSHEPNYASPEKSFSGKCPASSYTCRYGSLTLDFADSITLPVSLARGGCFEALKTPKEKGNGTSLEEPSLKEYIHLCASKYAKHAVRNSAAFPMWNQVSALII